jgi:hypothetical protein
MQFVKYRSIEKFEPLKDYRGNPRWHQNSKWRQFFKCQFNEFHAKFTPNAIFDISSILKQVQKQIQIEYLWYVDNISAFAV